MRSADVLLEARRRSGLTQRALAERVGRSQSAIARWESGRVKPSLELLEELVRACDLELDVVLSELDPAEASLLEATLRLTPAQRLDQLTRTVSFVTAGRASMDARRG